MWKLGWIDPNEYSFDCMLRMERFQIRFILEYLEAGDKPVMGAALKANPKVVWLWKQKCPERAGEIDALIAEENVFVVGEVILPINQTLMGVPGASIDDIRTVCSHAQGLAQSAEWRKTYLPDAVTEEMPSTAAAASYVSQTGDKTIAAIAAPGAAKLYGLSVLAENVQITDANRTRFYVLSSAPLSGDTLTHAVFTAVCEANRIDDIMIEIHNAGLELVTIHDRPEGSRLGMYNYIIETENTNGIPSEQIGKLSGIAEIRFLGRFDVIEK